MVDFSDLLEPIASEQPCGADLEYDPNYIQLGHDTTEKGDDLITGEKPLPINWREAQKTILNLLKKSRDMRLLVYLIRAQLHQQSLPDFKDTLQLLKNSLEQYWDTIYPQLDPDDGLDPTLRINIVAELNSFEQVIRPLSLLPLVESKAAGSLCLRDLQIATDKIPAPADVKKLDLAFIKGVFQDIANETAQARYAAICDSLTAVTEIEALLDRQVGMGNGVDLSPIKALLKDMRHYFETFAPQKIQDASAETEVEQEPGADGEPSDSQVVRKAQVLAGQIASRQDVLKAMDLIFKYYAEFEPSSPVPILLRRAQHLVTADFEAIVQNLFPDAMSQLDAIKGPENEIE